MLLSKKVIFLVYLLLVIGMLESIIYNSVFGSELSTFCTEHSYVLSDVDRLGCCSDSFTFLSEAHGTTSWIDHCVSTEQAHSSITDVNICYDMQSSDHFPISICIDVNYVPRLDCAYIPPQSRLNWSKASANDRSIYRDRCAELLGTIELPQNSVCCSNTSCKDVSHIEGTKDLYCCIVNALHCAALNVIPLTGANCTADDHNIPGWNDLIIKAPLNGDVHRAAVAFLVATFALRVVCTIQYDRQQLLELRGGTGGVSVHIALLCLNFDDFPNTRTSDNEGRHVRKRGKRGGVLARLRLFLFLFLLYTPNNHL